MYRKPLCFPLSQHAHATGFFRCTNPSFQAIQTNANYSKKVQHLCTHQYLSVSSYSFSLCPPWSLWCLRSAAPKQNEPPPCLRTPFLWQWEQASLQDTAKGWGQIPHWALRTLTNTPHSHYPCGVALHGSIHNTHGKDLSVTGADIHQRYKTPEKQLWSN